MQGFTLRSWDEHKGQGLAQEFDDAANVQDGKVLTAGDVVPYHQSNSVFDWQCRYVGALRFDLALPFLLHCGCVQECTGFLASKSWFNDM